MMKTGTPNIVNLMHGERDAGGLQMSNVYHRIRDDIISGRLPAGKKLRIEELKAEYGTGASPLREALSLLAPEGYVDRLENRGFRVSQVSRAEFYDLLEMRCWMEGRALRSSIENGDSDWESRVVLALYWFTQAFPGHRAEAADIPKRRKLHKAFHMALISECDSPILYRLCSTLHDQNERYRSFLFGGPPVERDYVAEHQRIVDAALSRDADAAVSLLAEHYTRTGKQIDAILGPLEQGKDTGGAPRSPVKG